MALDVARVLFYSGLFSLQLPKINPDDMPQGVALELYSRRDRMGLTWSTV